MKTKFAIPILAAALLCSALLFTAAPAQAAVSAQGTDAVQPASPFAPPPPPGPPPPTPPPTPPPHPRPHPSPADWPYYYGTPWPGYYSSAWPWVGTYSYYYNTAPVVVTQSYTEQSYVPIISSFTSNPSYIQPGQSAVLNWATTSASDVTISPSVGSVASSGAFTVQPNYTTTYTLTATSSSGTVSASTTVTVAPLVTAYSTTTPVSTPIVTSSQSSSSGTTPWLMYILLIALLAVAAVVVILLVTRRPAAAQAGTKAGLLSSSTAVSNGTAMATTPAANGHGAKLVASDGAQVDLGGKLGALGRKDFQSLVKTDRADLISRQHILLDYSDGHYYIEDKQSTNGTRLNGSAIKGTGRHMLNEGDTIELANAATFTFKT